MDPTGTFNVKFSNENGDQFEVNFTLNKNYDVWYEYIYHGYDWATQTFVDIYPSSWGANIYLYHYAGDFAYSFKWRSLYGYSGGYDSSSANGSFINAKTKVGATINLPSNDGIQHGGNLEYTISPSYYQSWDYTNDGWGDYTSHSWGYNTRYFGWGSGLTTTE